MERSVRRLLVSGMLVNLFLSLVKVGAGRWTGSRALFADGLHSLSDLLSDGLVWFAAHIGAQAPDAEHPYGHRRIETLVTLVLSVLLLSTGGVIVWEGIRHGLGVPVWHQSPYWALGIAALSTLLNEWFFQKMRHAADSHRSDLLRANAWHWRGDAWSSLIVFLSIAASLTGVFGFDAIAAIWIGALIARMGWRLGVPCVKELIDESISPESMHVIRQTIESVEGVQGVHALRTRSMAGDVLVDAHVLVSPRISVSEGHFIANQVEYALYRVALPIQDVTIHIDPEDDTEETHCSLKDTRSELEHAIRKAWSDCPEASFVHAWGFHYVKDWVEVDAYVHTDSFKALEPHLSSLQAKATALPAVRSLRFLRVYETV